MKPILIIDADEVRAQRLEDILVSKGHLVQQATCLFSALERMIDSEPAAILCADRAGANSPAELCKLKETAEELRAIPILAFGTSENNRSSLLRQGCVDYFMLPFESEEISARLEALSHTAPPGGLVGDLADVGLLDLVQMFLSARKSGTMSIEVEDHHGLLHFQEGQITSCAFDEEKGEEALLRLMRTARHAGTFIFFRSLVKFSGANIQKRTDHLLLSLANVLDEEG